MIQSVSSYISDFFGSRGLGNADFISKNASAVKIVALVVPIIYTGIIFAIANRHELIPFCQRCRHIVMDSFLPRSGESTQAAAQRIALNTAKVLGGALLVAGVVIGIYAFVHFGPLAFVAAKMSFIISKVIAISKILETPKIVYSGYSLMGVGHIIQSCRAFRDRDYGHGIKHIVAAIISLVIPIMMIMGLYEPRWHHLSYGLLALIPKNTSINFFGDLMVIDSMLYFVKPDRDKFDFSNIFEGNAAAFVLQMAALTIFDLVWRYSINKRTPKPVTP